MSLHPLSQMRESNPRYLITKQVHYHYANPAYVFPNS